MSQFGRSQDVAQPMRDPERGYERDRRALESVGADYDSKVIPYRAGFLGQYGVRLFIWATLETIWIAFALRSWNDLTLDSFGSFGLGLVELAFLLLTEGHLLELLFMLLGTLGVFGLWFLPPLVASALPLKWWRDYRALRAVDREQHRIEAATAQVAKTLC